MSADLAAAAPVAAPAGLAEVQAVFRYQVRGEDRYAQIRAAAAALADNGLAGESGYGVLAAATKPGVLVIERQDGTPLPSPRSPQWRKLIRLVREAIGPSGTGG